MAAVVPLQLLLSVVGLSLADAVALTQGQVSPHRPAKHSGRSVRTEDVNPVFWAERLSCRAKYTEHVSVPRIPTEEELQASDIPELATRLQERVTGSRRQWESFYLFKVMDALELYEGTGEKSAIGFAVGKGDPTVAYLASKSIMVVASDLPANASTTSPDSGKVAESLSFSLQYWNQKRMASDDQMDTYVLRERIDMHNLGENRVWKLRAGTFSFLWSTSAVQHLGSIRKALDFMSKSLELLAPGGAAVFTTDFNLQSLEETRDNSDRVFLRKKDIDAFRECVIKRNMEMIMPCYDLGDLPLDREEGPLRVFDSGFLITSLGITVVKPGHFEWTGYDCTPLFDSLF